ncbi:MAG: redoxin domain-containing protein [Myxococcales bacterium]|jgi:thiol-disulfide isomerase/thioredoxin|nr:redoxin domain-containing protein [Myxococcales bacterium]
MTGPDPTEPVTKEPRKWIHWLVTAMVFVALYAWMTRGNASPLMGEPAPDLTLAIAAGAESGGPTKVTLSEMGGQVVVLDFWASWCGACRRTTPVLNELNAEFAERGVAFYAVNVEPIDRQRLQAAHTAFGTEFPSLHDRAGTVQRRYAVKMLPTVIIVGQDGIVCWASTGVPSKLRLRRAISEALN